MSQPEAAGPPPSRSMYPYGQGSQSTNLADILERVLDKGIVIVGDIKINLLDIELLTIKLRLLVASVDKAKEIGIDWWEHDPALSSRANGERALEEQNQRLRAEITALRQRVAESPAELTDGGSGSRRSRETVRESAAEPRRRRRSADDATSDRGARSAASDRGARSAAADRGAKSAEADRGAKSAGADRRRDDDRS